VAYPPAPERSHPRFVKRWWVFWQSPDDQPRWARPALLAVVALAALAYAWGLDTAALEPFYAAAARSMSMSWHNFLFGAFDPDGTVTVDKLPGALWLQALSLRAFGVNTWAFVMPQVVEGILTVLVLFRAVRRLAGPGAGLLAALVLAASPVTVLLNRGNISDSLLILLLVLAADATSLAITTGRSRTLLLAGLWVGLAFQAKMMQAWLVLPALWLAYLIASPARGRRFGHVALATVVTGIVSVSWMLAVTFVPAHDRPYVDGSRTTRSSPRSSTTTACPASSTRAPTRRAWDPSPPSSPSVSRRGRSSTRRRPPSAAAGTACCRGRSAGTRRGSSPPPSSAPSPSSWPAAGVCVPIPSAPAVSCGGRGSSSTSSPSATGPT
jgi:hypothetical protein